MALFGLFGKKEEGPKDPYFLSPDESKTYGDIDYMRTTKTVRRTFVKTVGNPEGGEVVSQVSSNKMMKSSGNVARKITPKTTSSSFSSSFSSTTSSAPVTETTPEPKVEPTPAAVEETTPAPKVQPTPKPAQDTSMDMFRNMAKKIRR